MLYDKLDFGFSAIAEILLDSVLDDAKRLGEILAEMKSRSQMKLNSAGHSAAMIRSLSYFSPVYSFHDQTGGIAYYHFLEDMARHFEEKKDALTDKLKETAKRLFTAENMVISYTADEEGLKSLEGSLALLKDRLPAGDGTTYPFAFEKKNRNEGFITSSQVNYVARSGSVFKKGQSYTGALRILKVILGYDYLWLNVRVKGGAYGVMNGVGRFGDGYFVSYRDPKLQETAQVYEGVPAYIESFDADERDMTKYVIGTISDLDAPLLAPYKGAKADSAWFSHVTDEMFEQERREILTAGPEDIRALAGIVREVLSEGSLCVIGNAECIRKCEGMFGEIKNLFQM